VPVRVRAARVLVLLTSEENSGHPGASTKHVRVRAARVLVSGKILGTRGRAKHRL
jgi:hypothetical protein